MKTSYMYKQSRVYNLWLFFLQAEQLSVAGCRSAGEQIHICISRAVCITHGCSTCRPSSCRWQDVDLMESLVPVGSAERRMSEVSNAR